MTAITRLSRALAVAALGFVAASGAQAQATWDIDQCSGGAKNAVNNVSSGYTGCGGNAAANGVTLDVKAYTTTSATTAFSTTNINSQPANGYIGVLTGTEVPGNSSPHHAIDNYSGPGNTYEMVLLNFSAAVDLSSVIAAWSNDQAGGNADFMVFRWNATTAANMALKPNDMPTVVNGAAANGWTLVKTGDFDVNAAALTQTISDGNYFASSWLISTKFGETNDAFKLGSLSAVAVCTGNNSVVSGACTPNNPNPPGGAAPEPASLALFGVAAFGAGFARRRARVKAA